MRVDGWIQGQLLYLQSDEKIFRQCPFHCYQMGIRVVNLTIVKLGIQVLDGGVVQRCQLILLLVSRYSET